MAFFPQICLIAGIPAIHQAFEIADRGNFTREELDDLEQRERLLDDT